MVNLFFLGTPAERTFTVLLPEGKFRFREGTNPHEVPKTVLLRLMKEKPTLFGRSLDDIFLARGMEIKEEAEYPTRYRIMQMSKKDIYDLIQRRNLDVDVNKYDKVVTLKRAVIAAFDNIQSGEPEEEEEEEIVNLPTKKKGKIAREEDIDENDSST